MGTEYTLDELFHLLSTNKKEAEKITSKIKKTFSSFFYALFYYIDECDFTEIGVQVLPEEITKAFN